MVSYDANGKLRNLEGLCFVSLFLKDWIVGAITMDVGREFHGNMIL